jgi:hypothetical protein
MFVPTIPGVLTVITGLDRVIGTLNSESMDALSEKDLRVLAHDSAQIHGRLTKLIRIYREQGVLRFWPYSRLISKLESRSEHLASISEGLYMAVDDDFKCLLNEAMTGVVGVGLDRSIPLAEVHG